jgi:hypothetical protein
VSAFDDKAVSAIPLDIKICDEGLSRFGLKGSQTFARMNPISGSECNCGQDTATCNCECNCGGGAKSRTKQVYVLRLN